MWKCILEWRNSPTPGATTAQRLMSRRTRSMLPCSQTMYKPEVQMAVTEQVIHKRKQANYYHDRQTKSLPKLVIGQPVRVKSHPQQPHSSWKPGTVVSATLIPRSYTVKADGRKYRRNRVHLRDSMVSRAGPSIQKETQSVSQVASSEASWLKQPILPSPTTKLAQPPDLEQTDSKEASSAKSPVTRYGWVIKISQSKISASHTG